ncbi:MAG TPA: S8 family peptidase [Thermoanaerobaculia bacterium]|jgi:hypothetical protein|nr:S8 family peptidase [Thermoanaerobaculia bacterium]
MSKGGGAPNIHTPPADSQRVRLEPQLTALSKITTDRAGDLRSSPLGLAPEQVLVFEIVGTVEEFVAAVRRIEGMEWMSEWAAEDALPDEFFFDKKDAGKALPRRLFFVTANQRAMDQLLRLWKSWLGDPAAKFPHGFGKWKDVFRRLRSIRRWGIRDRLLETGVLEDWQYQIANGSGIVHVEIEFWFRRDAEARTRIEDDFADVVAAANGQIIARSAIPDIGYHAVLAAMPVQAVTVFVGDPDVIPFRSADASTDWLYFEQVMQARATGQIAIDILPEPEGTTPEWTAQKPNSPPIGALLDGMPLAQHVVLRDRLVVDDPLDWADNYTAARRVHGTAMASIIIRGDLNDEDAPPLESSLYVRPVMLPREETTGGEHIPRHLLSTDLLHSAVRRMFTGDGNEPPSAPTVRVINFSICHADRPFFSVMSPLARLLDWLAFEYGVLFVVSAGNHGDPIVLECDRGTVERLNAHELQNFTIRSVIRDARNRRILSPAESINSMTVGASHGDSAGAVNLPGGLINPILGRECFSPVGSLGFGFRRAVKPDVLAPGGRQVFRTRLGTKYASEILDPTPSPRPLGVSVAAPGGEGDTTARMQICGTSNAAARVTRDAIQIIETLDGVTDNAGQLLIADPFRSLASKCLLAHGATWGEALKSIEDATNGREGDPREIARRLLGYGCTSGSETATCTDERVTVLGVGELNDGDAHLYDLPIPSELSGRVLWRKLSVTLAWNSPIRIHHQKYRGAGLWFAVPEFKRFALARSEADWQAVRRGTLQHEIFQGTDPVVVNDGEHLRVVVNCNADAGRLMERVPYVLAVSLEVAEGVAIPMYDRVSARLRQMVPIRA